MTPKIDYPLIAEALKLYGALGYRYVEVPWIVPEYAIRATLPEGFDFMQVGVEPGYAPPGAGGLLQPYYDGENALVGSAEQGFITMSLEPGAYVGVTPCFRCEQEQDLFTRDTFMKVELFDNRLSTTMTEVVEDAMTVHRSLADSRSTLRRVEIGDTYDIYLGGREVGSYGVREHPHFGRWVYGTGLALPRFSVCNALGSVL